MHESPVRSVPNPPDEALFRQPISEIARGRLMQRHALGEIVHAHAFPSGNFRESPQLRAGDRHGPAHLRIVPPGGGVDQSQVLKRLKLGDVSLRGLRSITALNAALWLPICPACTNTGSPRERAALLLHSVTHA